MPDCRPPEGTEANTAHLLFNGEEDVPWIWTGDGWSAVPRAKPIDPWRMGIYGWAYRGAR